MKYGILALLVLTLLVYPSSETRAGEEWLFPWKSGTAMPAPRSNCAVVPWEDRIYIMGGNDERGATATFWEYEPAKDSWHSLPEIPRPRCAHDAFVVNGSILILGGMSQEQGRTIFPRSIDAFDLKSGKWSTIGEMPAGLARAGVALWKNRVVLAGGIDESDKATALVHTFDPVNGWSFLPPLPEARNRHCLFSAGGSLMVVGGEDSSGKASGSTLIFNEKEQRWDPGPPLGEKRKNFALLPFGSTPMVTGGWDQNEGKKRFIAATEMLDKDSWHLLSPLNASRDGVRGCVCRGKAYIFGGFNGSLLSSAEEGSWRVSEGGWAINESLRFHLAFFDDKESRLHGIDSVTSAPLDFTASHLPDISNIVLKNILALDFPLPRRESPEHQKFYLKFYHYPANLDQKVSARKVIETFLIDDLSRGETLISYTKEKQHVIVKKGLIESEKRNFRPQAPYPPLSLPKLPFNDCGIMTSPQDYFDRQVPFASLYVIPRGGKRENDAALDSARGVVAFHSEILGLYRRVFTEIGGPPGYHNFVDESAINYGLNRPLRISLYRIPKSPLIFKNYRDLPMPQDPSRIFLTALLLLYRQQFEMPPITDGPLTVALIKEKGIMTGAQVFEVGSVMSVKN
jgi:hypothetical protein